MKKQFLSAVMTAAMLSVLLGGCGSSSATETAADASGAADTTTATEAATVKETETGSSQAGFFQAEDGIRDVG